MVRAQVWHVSESRQSDRIEAIHTSTRIGVHSETAEVVEFATSVDGERNKPFIACYVAAIDGVSGGASSVEACDIGGYGQCDVDRRVALVVDKSSTVSLQAVVLGVLSIDVGYVVRVKISNIFHRIIFHQDS